MLLLALIASYLLAAFDDGPLGTDIQLGLFMAVLLLALRHIAAVAGAHRAGSSPSRSPAPRRPSGWR